MLLIGAVGRGLADEALTSRDVPAKTIPVPSSVSTHQAETLVRLGLRQRAAIAPLTDGSAIGIDTALSQRPSR